MSIYCSTFGIGDEHSRKCERVKKVGAKMYEQDDAKPCTCGSCPIVYQGSHVVPSDKDRRDGVLSLGAIPGHIDGPKLKALSDDMTPYHPWLRISLWQVPESDATVLLTLVQVIALRDALTRWVELTMSKP